MVIVIFTSIVMLGIAVAITAAGSALKRRLLGEDEPADVP